MTVKQRIALWRKRRHEADDRIKRLNQRIKTRVIRLAQRPALAAFLAREFDLRFTSGWRSVARNAIVGGVLGSWHTKGTRLKPGAIDMVGTTRNMERALTWVRWHVRYLDESMIHDVGSGLHLHLGGWGVANWRMPSNGTLTKWRESRTRGRLARGKANRMIRWLKASRPITTVSAEGVAFIAEYEGGQGKDGLFHPYQDPVGVWTQGFGHTAGVTLTDKPWSKAKAERVLRTDLNQHYAPHVARLGLPLTQAQFDALTSFVFNLGAGAIGSSTGVGRELRAKRWQKAADEILKWDKAGNPPRPLPGLTRRRKAERTLFLSDLPR